MLRREGARRSGANGLGPGRSSSGNALCGARRGFHILLMIVSCDVSNLSGVGQAALPREGGSVHGKSPGLAENDPKPILESFDRFQTSRPRRSRRRGVGAARIALALALGVGARRLPDRFQHRAQHAPGEAKQAVPPSFVEGLDRPPTHRQRRPRRRAGQSAFRPCAAGPGRAAGHRGIRRRGRSGGSRSDPGGAQGQNGGSASSLGSALRPRRRGRRWTSGRAGPGNLASTARRERDPARHAEPRAATDCSFGQDDVVTFGVSARGRGVLGDWRFESFRPGDADVRDSTRRRAWIGRVPYRFVIRRATTRP